MPGDGETQGQGARRPRDEDLEPLLEMIWEGKSLSKACRSLGLHIPSTDVWLHADDSENGRSEQYARACEGRGEFLQEDALDINRAAALGLKIEGQKVDASGAKGYLDAVKWAKGRMAPKKEPVQRIDVTSRTRQMTDAEIAADLAQLGGDSDDETD